MKFIMAHPAIKRFEWEDDIAITNLVTLGVSPQDIIVLMREGDPLIPQRIRDRFGVSVFTFPDSMDLQAKQYIPAIRPWLWWQFLSKYPEYENEDFMYQDSDIIYRRIPNFNKMPVSKNHWYCADTESYTGPDYINSKGGTLLRDTGAFMGLSVDQMWSFKGSGGGAQWVISHPKAEYWKDVYNYSYMLYGWFKSIEGSYIQMYKREGRPNEYPIQSWCAEMYAELYLCAKYGIHTEISDELNFAWSTDLVDSYSKNRNILHNAGVTFDLYQSQKLFYKGLYDSRTPFTEDLSWVNPLYMSKEYVDAIQKTKDKGGVTTE